jgi:hypothetical protein
MVSKKIFCCIFFISQAYAELTQETKLFIKNHQLENNLIQQLDVVFNHLDPRLKKFIDGKGVRLCKKEIIKLFTKDGFKIYRIYSPLWGSKIARVITVHKSIPEFFLKIGFDRRYPLATISRAIIADFLNSLGQKPQLAETNLGIIKKKLYHKPGCAEDFNDFSYIVISPRIHGIPLARQKNYGYIFTSLLCEKIFKNLTQDAGFKFIKSIMGRTWDHYPHNLILGTDGKLYCIDTEPIKVYEQLSNPDSFISKLINLTLGLKKDLSFMKNLYKD